jgi:O-antigen/teichoic acid export membrane protein
MPLRPYLMGIIAVFTFASIFLASLNLLSPFLPLKFKPYLQDLYLISIIVFAFAFRSIYQFLNPFFIKTNKTHIITASSFVGCIICIIFTFYLVPIYSSRGAAFAVLLGLLSSSICSGIYFWSINDKPREYGIKNIEEMV